MAPMPFYNMSTRMITVEEVCLSYYLSIYDMINYTNIKGNINFRPK